MMKVMKMIIILVMSCLAPEIRAQTIELKRLEEHYVNSELSVKKKYSQYFKGEDSEYKLILYSSFAFYKEFMSSQDGENCAFHPSCSEYAVEAIRRKGIALGLIAFFDRFTRCNSPERGYYKEDLKIKKYLDPVDEN